MLSEFILQRSPIARFPQRRPVLLLRRFLELLAKFIFAIRKLPGFLTQIAHGIGEAGRRLLPEIVVQLLQFARSARVAELERLRELAFAQLLGRVELPLTRLLQLLPGVSELVLPIRLGDAVAEFVGVLQQLLLFFAKPLQLSLDFFFLLFRRGAATGKFEFFQLLGEIGLPASQFAKPVENAEVFLLRCLRFGRCRLPGFVAVLLVRQLQFLELLFVGARAAARSSLLLLLAFHYAVIAHRSFNSD